MVTLTFVGRARVSALTVISVSILPRFCLFLLTIASKTLRHGYKLLVSDPSKCQAQARPAAEGHCGHQLKHDLLPAAVLGHCRAVVVVAAHRDVITSRRSASAGRLLL